MEIRQKKSNFKRISKSALSIILALMMVVSTMLVGMVSVNAFSFSGGYFYFDNTYTNWNYSNTYFVYGNDSAYNKNIIYKIPNTKMFYYKYGGNWSDIKYFCMFADNNSWGTGTVEKTYSDISTYAPVYTEKYSGDFNFNSGNYNLLTTSGGTVDAGVVKNVDISPTYLGNDNSYTALNYNQSVTAQTSTDGSNYSDASSAPATIKVSSYKMNGNNSTTESTNSGTGTTTSAAAARTATVTLSYENLNSQYTFEDWYDGDTLKSKEATYTYSATEAKTYYARFKKATAYNITLNSVENLSAISSKVNDVNSTVAYSGDSVTITVTPSDGYKCTGITVTKSSGGEITDVTDNGDSTYSFAMPGEDVTVTPTIVLSGGSEGTLSDRYFFISTSEGYNWKSDSMPSIYQAYYDSNYYYITLTAQELKTLTNNNIKSNLYFALSSSQSLDNLYHLNESYSDNKWDAINETPESCNIEKNIIIILILEKM